MVTAPNGMGSQADANRGLVRSSQTASSIDAVEDADAQQTNGLLDVGAWFDDVEKVDQRGGFGGDAQQSCRGGRQFDEPRGRQLDECECVRAGSDDLTPAFDPRPLIGLA